MTNLGKISFGGTAAIVTSMGVISGLGLSAGSRAAVTASLLVIAIADNLTDSLAVHVYQESELLDTKRAFHSTVVNFFVRLAVALSFVLLAVTLPERLIVPVGLGWGLSLLGTLSWLVARQRGVSPWVEVAKHLFVAFVVIVVSRLIGAWILSHVS